MKTKTQTEGSGERTLKLNYKRTFIIGFAFFGILLWCQIYDTWCPSFLTELFCKAFNKSTEDVQYLVGVMMAIDNIAALVLLPVFGRLSDKTHTRIGKRMPFILIGTFVCAVCFPFIPLCFHFNSIVGTIIFMAICVCFAMMYRNPAVALMPDLTPKPLRSKANGIINIMGYFGGAFAVVVGMIFVWTTYLKQPDGERNLWLVEAPFLVGSILMVISALVLFFSIKEDKVLAEVKDDLEYGEKMSETADAVDDDKPLTKANKIMLWCILIAEFFWFMADNGVSTFFMNYCVYHLGCKSSSSLIATIVGGVASVGGFALGGIFCDKIGRKWTVILGLGLTLAGYLVWILCGTVGLVSLGKGADGFTVFPWYIFIVWGMKGFGMSLVHVNSLPMVVELCNSKKIGTFTGYYYASSMSAQSITPVLLGLLMLSDHISWGFLPIYAAILVTLSGITFLFVKSVKNKKTKSLHGLEAIGAGDD